MTVLDDAIANLKSLDGQSSLNSSQLTSARQWLLQIANFVRVNMQPTDYLPQLPAGVRKPLPLSLRPLQLHNRLNAAAQNQADFNADYFRKNPPNAPAQFPTSWPADPHNQPNLSAASRMVTFGVPNVSNYECAGWSTGLEAFPKQWMTGDHYKPWFNLQGQSVSHIGFGISCIGTFQGYNLWSVYATPALFPIILQSSGLISVQALTGRYICADQPYTGSFTVDIKQLSDRSGVSWSNLADESWTLVTTNLYNNYLMTTLDVGSDCPYFNDGKGLTQVTIVYDTRIWGVSALRFGSRTYVKQK
jgi:hypothetical protein